MQDKTNDTAIKIEYLAPEVTVLGRVEDLTAFFLGGFQDNIMGRFF